MENKIKLKDLALDTVKGSQYANRSLKLYNEDGGFIRITPYVERKAYMGESSIKCVDEGALFGIKLDNDELVYLRSFNDFNCEGQLFFNSFEQKDINKLKQHKITIITVSSREDLVGCLVPENQSDYFIQLMNLLYPEK